MAARRPRERQDLAPGWLSTTAGAVLLVVVGFGVGLVAGAAWEEPDLVMDHLAGRTTEVSLVADVPEELPEPAVRGSAARPLGIGEGSLAESRAEVRREPPPVAAPPPSSGRSPTQGGFAIQVGAFGDQASAQRLARDLRAAGYPVYVHSEDDAKRARFRVRVGPFSNRDEATRLAGKLKSDHQLPTWILSGDSH
jgi:cell division septation protein DedD